jgi:small subunit ribosomal protein S4
MGDPKKQRKKYKTPMHPWQKSRIEEEAGLITEYGLASHKELWKMKTFIKNSSDIAKKLIVARGTQADIEKKQLISKLSKLGLLKEDATTNEVLNLKPKDVLERRLQTIVVRKGLANSFRQSRQLITHGHIAVNGQKQTAPSYLVEVAKENLIDFVLSSPFRSLDHPERNKILSTGTKIIPASEEEIVDSNQEEKNEASEKIAKEKPLPKQKKPTKKKEESKE